MRINRDTEITIYGFFIELCVRSLYLNPLKLSTVCWICVSIVHHGININLIVLTTTTQLFIVNTPYLTCIPTAASY